MSSYSHAQAEETSSLETPHGFEDMWGATHDASVFRSYTVEGSIDAVVADMLAEAEIAGWEFDPDPPTPAGAERGFTSWYATKAFPEGQAHLSITSGPFSVGEMDIGMRLEFEDDAGVVGTSGTSLISADHEEVGDH
jgi:hypothetical protein